LQLTVALVRNALGVAYGTRGAIEDARTNLEQACALAPSFLDARASLGTLKITQRAPEGALTEFDEVLYVSPDFALALIGRGCALFRMGEWDEAEKSFTNCMQVACAQGPASVNLSILMEARMQQVSNQLAAATGGLVPGTTLQTEVQQLANRLSTDLPSLRSPDQVQHYYEGLHQHYDLPTVALASDYVMKGLATHMLSLCQQANSYNQQYLETAQGAACKMGWGRTLADLGNAIDLVSKGAAVTKRVDVAFLTGAGSVLLKQGGQDLKDLSSSSLATANQAFRLASDSLQQAAQLNNIRVAVNQVFADPGGWKRTYSMDLSGNLGQDFTVARTMAGNVRAGADVLIVCNKPDVADVLRNEALNRGVAPAQIRIVPEFSQTLAGQFGSPSSVILNVRGGLNIGSIPTPGGVRAAVKKPFVDKGWNLVMPYGLLYEIKPSTATAVGADWRQ
jgi:Flp pilus assembly protein TadD